MRLILTSIFVCLLLSALRAEEARAPAEVPVAVSTTGGSRVVGFLKGTGLTLRTDRGAVHKLDWSSVRSIGFGQRADRNLENEALVALGDLQNDQFETREKALLKLRSLGRSALRPLRQASSGHDPEVAARAKTLLAEMNLQNAALLAGEQVTLADGKSLSGEIAPAEFTVRTRYGVLRFPLGSLELLEVVPAEQVATDKLILGEPLAVSIGAQDATKSAAERWHPEEAAERIAAPVGQIMAGVTALTMERVPNPEARQGKGPRTVEANPGDNLGEAYAAWGVLLRADANVELVASEQLITPRPGLSLEVKKSDLNVHFILPGSFVPKDGTGRAGGVFRVGAMVAAAPRLSIGLAAYDRAGQLLAEVYNNGYDEQVLQAARGQPFGEFLGVQARVPIARVRFFRVAEARAEGIALDDLVFDRIVPIDRPPQHAAVWLAGGERLAGGLTGVSAEGVLAFQPDFLANGKAAELQLEEIERFEPPRQLAELGRDGPKEEDPKQKLRRLLGTPHGVLLQSGDSFRALFRKLDDKDVVFLLPGAVELKLPRSVIRKIEFAPAAAEPGELPPAVQIADTEKPGVDFRRKSDGQKAEGAPNAENKPEPADQNAADPKKKGDVLQNTQELQPMPDVKILEADLLTGDLTIEDENGPWTIGLAPVKTLVFPKDPNAAKATPKFREWVLTLREGSRFETSVLGLSPDAIKVEMAGGTVTLPFDVLDSLQRKKP